MQNSQELAKVIKAYAKLKKISIGELLKRCELSINTLSSMQSGGYYPRLEAIFKIADELDCSVDYLLGRTSNPDISISASAKLKEDEEALLNEWRKLSIENQTYIRDKINTLNEANEYNLDKSSTNEAFGA